MLSESTPPTRKLSSKNHLLNELDRLDDQQKHLQELKEQLGEGSLESMGHGPMLSDYKKLAEITLGIRLLLSETPILYLRRHQAALTGLCYLIRKAVGFSLNDFDLSQDQAQEILNHSKTIVLQIVSILVYEADDIPEDFFEKHAHPSLIQSRSSGRGILNQLLNVDFNINLESKYDWENLLRLLNLVYQYRKAKKDDQLA